MNIELPKKYRLSQERIVVFEIRLHSKSLMLYRPVLHGNWNALSLARRALNDKFPTPTVPLRSVLPNRRVFLPDPVLRHSNEMAEKYNKNLIEDTWCPDKTFQVGKFQKQIKLPFLKISSQIISRPSPMLTKVFC
jgi:hypothetical protein